MIVINPLRKIILLRGSSCTHRRAQNQHAAVVRAKLRLQKVSTAHKHLGGRTNFPIHWARLQNSTSEWNRGVDSGGIKKSHRGECNLLPAGVPNQFKIKRRSASRGKNSLPRPFDRNSHAAVCGSIRQKIAINHGQKRAASLIKMNIPPSTRDARTTSMLMVIIKVLNCSCIAGGRTRQTQQHTIIDVPLSITLWYGTC
jgi:hypothetical protein